MRYAKVPFIIVVFLAGLVWVPCGRAQHWSPAETEVLDFTQACWDLFGAKEYDEVETRCWHADYTRWFSEGLVSVDAAHERTMVREFFTRNSWMAWDVQPLRIRVVDRSAVIQYQVLTYRMSDAGEESFQIVGRSDFLVRTDDGWRVLAVHEHPVE